MSGYVILSELITMVIFKNCVAADDSKGNQIGLLRSLLHAGEVVHMDLVLCQLLPNPDFECRQLLPCAGVTFANHRNNVNLKTATRC